MIEPQAAEGGTAPSMPPAEDEAQQQPAPLDETTPLDPATAASVPSSGHPEAAREESAGAVADPTTTEARGAGREGLPSRSGEDLWNPEHEEAATVTRSPSGPSLALGFNLAKIADKGEDADPIVRHGRHLGLVAVFDGMGGAGGTLYETAQGPRTGAYLASRVARDVVEPHMLRLLDPEWNLDGPAAARELQRAVKQALVETLTELNAPTSGLRSRLIRALPTTMAMMALQRRDSDGDQWTGHLLWSGDSRVYVMDPRTGAHQLTTDDIRDAGDAMVNLRQDSVLSNVMSADTDFVVRHREVEIGSPFLAIAATDGCFGYLPSPMHFEHLVLAALRDSRDAEDWSTAMQSSIGAVAGDDAALGLLAVGADHAELQDLFAARTVELERRWIRPLDELGAEVRRAEQALQEARHRQVSGQAQLWGAYKAQYERYFGATEQGEA